MKRRKVLVAVLDWGLGHATRCIPVIKHLEQIGCEVHLASSGQGLHVLQTEFPDFPSLQLPAYRVKYYSKLPFMVGIFLQLPKFLRAMSGEKKVIDQYLRAHHLDLIISDNRYWARHPNVYSVFIGHQMTILMPLYLRWAQPLVNFFNRKFINSFDQCWIPDHEQSGLTGRLSRPIPTNAKMIGWLSRFTGSPGQPVYDLAVILSGPEPRRTEFENIILRQLRSLPLKTVLVRGVQKGRAPVESFGDVRVVDYLHGHELERVLNESALILCRSGYSSVMDMAVMSKKVIFVPTPGQTEQEYLAEILKERRIAYYETEDQFNLVDAIKNNTEYKGFDGFDASGNQLKEAIEEVVL